MAAAAKKNKIRTFEAEIGPQNKNIQPGQNLLVLNKKKCMTYRKAVTESIPLCPLMFSWILQNILIHRFRLRTLFYTFVMLFRGIILASWRKETFRVAICSRSNHRITTLLILFALLKN